MVVANTLAYYDTALKSFIVQAPSGNTAKHILTLIDARIDVTIEIICAKIAKK